MRPDVVDGSPWLVTDDEGDHAVAMIKDINAFHDDLESLLQQKRIQGWRDGLYGLLHNMEFAMVTVHKNGTIRWQSGKFVE